jgi:hypothetical protein
MDCNGRHRIVAPKVAGASRTEDRGRPESAYLLRHRAGVTELMAALSRLLESHLSGAIAAQQGTEGKLG